MNRIISSFIASAVLVLLAAVARAESTNYWIGAGGDFTNLPNWSLVWDPADPGSATNNAVSFTNANAGTPYTVQFTRSVTNSVLNVGSSNQALDITYDLNGYRWRSGALKTTSPGGINDSMGFFNRPGETGVVTFSSSSAPAVAGGNQVELQAAYNTYGTYTFGANLSVADGRWSVMNINDSLGYPVLLYTTGTVYYCYGGRMQVNIDGPGSGLVLNSGTGGLAFQLNVTNGGLFRSLSGVPAGAYGGPDAYWTITDSTLDTKASPFNIGWGYAATISLSNSTWTTGNLIVGRNRLYGSSIYNGSVYLTNSTLTTANIQPVTQNQISNSTVATSVGYGNDELGRLTLVDSAMHVSNGLFSIEGNTYSGSGNLFVLQNSSLGLGAPGQNVTNIFKVIPSPGVTNTVTNVFAAAGMMTNKGVMRASGVIRGVHAQRGHVVNEGFLEIGSSIGTLALTNLNLVLAAGSSNVFEFSDTGRDQVLLDVGAASLLGTNVFQLADGSALPEPGYKWGLGTYDFLVASNITWNPQYANLTNLLNGYGLVQGLDYTFGVQDFGTYQVLRLEFVPEPSTVVLLLGGGLLLVRLRRRARSGALLGLALAGAWLAVPARAVETTNFWDGSSGDYTNMANWNSAWDPITLSASTNIAVFFTNANAGTPYTVAFSRSVSNASMHVGSSNQAMDLTFDMNGYRWRSQAQQAGTLGFFNLGGETGAVTFSSSAAPAVTGGNEVELVTLSGTSGPYHFGSLAGVADDRHSVLNINTNLGYPVVVKTLSSGYVYGGHMTVNIDGPGAALEFPAGTGGGFAALVNVTGGGRLTYGAQRAVGAYSSVTDRDTLWAITDSLLETPNTAFNVGWGYAGTLYLSNSTWTANGVNVGNNRLYGTANVNGTVIMSNSTMTANTLLLGGGADDIGHFRLYDSTATISNGYLLLNSGDRNGQSNTVLLSNSTIVMGKTGTDGVLTNRGIVRGTGVIRGAGAGKLLVRSESLLYVGNSIGTLVLSNANLELAAGSKTYFELSDTGLDQILAEDGYASLLGSNFFTLAAGSALPAPGYKWGLGTYDFVVASNITWNPQYADITNLLNGYGLVEGLDYTFGVQDFGTYQVLRLEFVPEPSTVILLLGGGLLLWRVRRRVA